MEIGHGIWLLIMMGGAVGGLAFPLAALIAWRAGRRRIAGGFLAGLVGLAALYLVALVGISTAAPRRLLTRGEVKRFCGFYLDCHLGVSVDDVRSARTVGTPEHLVTARGMFQIITLRVSSDARRAALSPYGLTAILVDDGGRRYRRDRVAERALLGAAADRPLEQEVAAGASYTCTLVYDLPAGAVHPALSVTEQALPDAVIEWFLIGDEDSLFHEPTLLSIAPAGTAEARVRSSSPRIGAGKRVRTQQQGRQSRG